MEKPTYDMLLDFLISVDKDFPTPLSEKVNLHEWTEKLLNRAVLCYTEIEGQIASAVAGYTENLVDGVAYITMVATRAAFRGRKLAYKNVKDFIEICRDKNISAVHLYVASGNETARKMYCSLGFVEYRIQNEPRPDDIHLIYYVDLNEAELLCQLT